jgi:hypothetical protein
MDRSIDQLGRRSVEEARAETQAPLEDAMEPYLPLYCEECLGLIERPEHGVVLPKPSEDRVHRFLTCHGRTPNTQECWWVVKSYYYDLELFMGPRGRARLLEWVSTAPAPERAAIADFLCRLTVPGYEEARFWHRRAKVTAVASQPPASRRRSAMGSSRR